MKVPANVAARIRGFRERAGFTLSGHWAALRHDLRQAGLHARLAAIPETG